MPNVTVDGIAIEVPAGATVRQACGLAGKKMPSFPRHQGWRMNALHGGDVLEASK